MLGRTSHRTGSGRKRRACGEEERQEPHGLPVKFDGYIFLLSEKTIQKLSGISLKILNRLKNTLIERKLLKLSENAITIKNKQQVKK